MDAQPQQAVKALFVGYEDQENLGLRSIIATLSAAGFDTALEPYMPNDPGNVLRAVQRYKPDLVGFSIIFQYTLDQFGALMAALRQAGVHAHFTAGGHFPSLNPHGVMQELWQLDSVVRFEGELTVLELLRRLREPETWSSIEGLVFRRGAQVILNPPRPLIADLDTLPLPLRDRPRMMTRGIRAASLLASRGCLYNCAFCSIRQFYGSAPGPLRRARSPEHVVAEMRELFEREGVRLFFFQDDDFANRSRAQRGWLAEFLRQLDAAGLSREVRWKISCRVDDIEEEVVARCREHGLIAVYLGVESGSPMGLKTLNKHVTVERNLAAITTLKKQNVDFDMGFMLFDPDSTVESILENLGFLRKATLDGACPLNFCKMLPYAGTPIEARLRQEGRLKGTVSRPDYNFLDPHLDWYSFLTARIFRFRNFDFLGLVERLRLARFDQILAREFCNEPWVDDYEHAIRGITARMNALVLKTLEAGLNAILEHEIERMAADWSLFGYLAEQEWDGEIELQRELDHVLARYSPKLLQAAAAEFSRRYSDPQRVQPAMEFV